MHFPEELRIWSILEMFSKDAKISVFPFFFIIEMAIQVTIATKMTNCHVNWCFELFDMNRHSVKALLSSTILH